MTGVNGLPWRSMAEQLQELFLFSSRHVYDISILHDHLPSVAADIPLDVFEIYEMRVMNAVKMVRLKYPLEILQQPCDNQVPAIRQKDPGIIGVGFDTVNKTDGYEFQPVARGDSDPVLLALYVSE